MPLYLGTQLVSGRGRDVIEELLEGDSRLVPSGVIKEYIDSNTVSSAGDKMTGTLEMAGAAVKTTLDTNTAYSNPAPIYWRASNLTGILAINFGSDAEHMAADLTLASQNINAKLTLNGYAVNKEFVWARAAGLCDGFKPKVRTAGDANGNHYFLLGETTTSWGGYLHSAITNLLKHADVIDTGHGVKMTVTQDETAFVNIKEVELLSGGESNKILSVEMGGTGADNAEEALTNLGAVPNTRKINNKALNADITLSANDVGAYSKTEVDDKIAQIPEPDPTAGTLVVTAISDGINIVNVSHGVLDVMAAYEAGKSIRMQITSPDGFATTAYPQMYLANVGIVFASVSEGATMLIFGLMENGVETWFVEVLASDVDAHNSDIFAHDDIRQLIAAKANTSSLAKVATSGSYNDLSNKPTAADIGAVPATGGGQLSGDYILQGNFTIEEAEGGDDRLTVSGEYSSTEVTAGTIRAYDGNQDGVWIGADNVDDEPMLDDDGAAVVYFGGTGGDEHVRLRRIAEPLYDYDAANKEYADKAGFVINATPQRNEDGEINAYTLDKTYDEIVEAIESGQRCVCRTEDEYGSVEETSQVIYFAEDSYIEFYFTYSTGVMCISVDPDSVSFYNGRYADFFEVYEHNRNKSNPHGVTASQINAVPTTRKINNKALSADITLTADDVGARPSTWLPSLSTLGAVPTSRKVNNKALSSDITLTASDVGAFAKNDGIGMDNGDPIIFPTTASGATRIRLYSGRNAAYDGGAGIVLTNKNATSKAGSFEICAHNGTNSAILSGSPDGTLTWKNNQILHAGNKNLITPSDIGAAPTSHTHSAADVTSGTLAIARGGFGRDMSNIPKGAIIRYSTDNTGFWYSAPANGAFYATGADTIAKFGTLPIAQGGTGATTAAAALAALGAYSKTEVDNKIASAGGHVVSPNQPTDTSKLWINSSTGVLSYHNGSAWVGVKGVWG